MPRKVGTAPYSKFDLRITPTDQLPIVDWALLDVSEKYMIFQEGGEGTTAKLHYHIYLEGNVSESTMKKYCAILGRATASIKGNAVFKCGIAHDNTIGYLVKDQLCVAKKGYDQTQIEDYYRKSEAYAKGLQADRRKDSRKREQILGDVYRQIIVSSDSDPHDIIEQCLQLCTKMKVKFPTRSQMESLVYGKLYPFNPTFVIALYKRNFDRY